MGKIKKILAYLVLSFGSFALFLYMTFPFQISKETLANEVTKATGMATQIKSLGPSFPLGIKLEGLTLSNPGGVSFEMKSTSVNLSLLSLLMANAELTMELEDTIGGNLEAEIRFGLFDLMGAAKNAPMPNRFVLRSKKFNLGPLVNFILAKVSQGDVNPLVKPLLEAFQFQGHLNSKVQINIKSGDFSKSQGAAQIQIAKSALLIIDDN